MKTSKHGRLWLKLSWNMPMPWFCFHLEPVLGGGLSLDFRMHRMASCEPPQHVFVPSDASPSTYLWAIIWGRAWMFILAEIPSRIHAYFPWPEKWPCVSCYTKMKRAWVHIHCKKCEELSPRWFALFKKYIFSMLLLLLETLLALFYTVLVA